MFFKVMGDNAKWDPLLERSQGSEEGANSLFFILDLVGLTSAKLEGIIGVTQSFEADKFQSYSEFSEKIAHFKSKKAQKQHHQQQAAPERRHFFNSKKKEEDPAGSWRKDA
jgi:hypothetical protein